MQHIYGLFGFEFHLELSTRPDNYLCTIETWNEAERVSVSISISPSPLCASRTQLLIISHIDTKTKSRPQHAKQQLTKTLDAHYSGKWEINPGDGAFYGPKIDITIRDAPVRRSFQCATIQLPERFNLKYRSVEEMTNLDKPPLRSVMIHRAILGSLNRFIGIVTEHFAGKW